MLRRAASNAYSWWWASHIRTKQSKWLEENLQDIEDKVQYALKLLEDEGDSFAKRAEMYYKRRPELISFVEEAFKAYRALAERYDHISKELQNANTTIASIFPDQVPEFAMDDDDDSLPPRFPKKQTDMSNQGIPNVPEFPKKQFAAVKKFQSRKSFKGSAVVVVNKSGLSRAEAVEEIDKLQKEILALQTEKEFMKSSYESALAKYWDIENSIMEKQERICSLQDEFDESVGIEDTEAERLMSATALKSCQEKLTELREKQAKTVEEANIERKRIRESKEEFVSRNGGLLCDTNDQGNRGLENDSIKPEKGLSVKEEETESDPHKQKELESSGEKMKKDFEVGTSKCLTLTDMAEKIDELVNNVISLESLVSSQTALIQRLRGEIDDLQAQIRALQENKLSKTDDNTVLRNKLREVEGKLNGIQDLDRMVEEQSKNLEKKLTEAHDKLSCLSERLRNLKPEEVQSAANVPIPDEGSLTGQECHEGKSAADQDYRPNIAGSGQKKEHTLKSRFKHQDNAEAEAVLVINDSAGEVNLAQGSGTPQSSTQKQTPYKPVDERYVSEKHILSPKSDNAPDIETTKQSSGTEEEPFLQQLLSHGMEDREKILLTEYTKVLRNYKEAKRKLGETESKLNNENTMKNEEIKFLRRKLSLLQKAKGDGDDLQDLRAADNQQDPLFMLIGREDNTGNGIQTMSQNEQQLRTRIDALLGENLDLLVRFSNSLGQIQQFDTGIKDLQAETLKIKEQKKQDGGIAAKYSLRSSVRPIYRHLREIHTELSVWLEKSWLLKEEINSRSSSLTNIQDEITEALKTDSEEGEMKFTIYQAAEFLGEISNMRKENNRIADELQAGLNHITMLQLEADKTLEKLNEEFALSESKNHSSVQHSNSKTRIPLRSFIFDTKPKKQRLSFFSCMQPSLYKKSKLDS